MKKRLRWVVGLATGALLAVIVYSTFQQNQYRYEVCVTFHSRSHCATAAGRTPEEAIQSAKTIGCSLLTSGRDANMVCLDAQPTTVRPLADR